MFVGGGNERAVDQRTKLTTIVSEKYSMAGEYQTINAIPNTSGIIYTKDWLVLVK